MIQPSSRLGPVLFWILLAGGFLVTAMGVFFIVDHQVAADCFGVALSGGADNAYITVAAVRDLAFGVLTLAFTILRDRRAVGLCLLFGAIIPLGDGLVVLGHSATPWRTLPLHWGGALACVVFAIILLRRPRDQSK